jgi:hypothetical protein
MSTISIDNSPIMAFRDLSTWGLIGFIIVLFLFFSYFLSAKRKGAKINVKNIMPFLIITKDTIRALFHGAFMIIMLLLLIAASLLKENKN